MNVELTPLTLGKSNTHLRKKFERNSTGVRPALDWSETGRYLPTLENRHIFLKPIQKLNKQCEIMITLNNSPTRKALHGPKYMQVFVFSDWRSFKNFFVDRRTFLSVLYTGTNLFCPILDSVLKPQLPHLVT